MLHTRNLQLVVTLSLSLAAITHAAPATGDLQGVTRTAEGRPVAGVRIVIHNVDENVDRKTVSNDEGRFKIERLVPGRYQLAASKDGLANSAVIAVNLRQQESLRIDLVLPAVTPSPATTDAVRMANAPSRGGDSAGSALSAREKQLLDRIDRLEQRLAALEAREEKPTTAPVASGQAARATPPSVTAAATLENPSSLASPPRPEAAPTTAAPTTLAASLVPASVPNSPGKPQPLPNPPSAAAATDRTSTAPEKEPKAAPFSDADWTWLNGNPRTKDIFWDTKFFTPEIRADITSNYNFNHPADHSMGGSSEIFRSNEVQLEQLGVGGDFHYDNVRARLMTQFGMYSVTTPRNDPSPGHGQWDLVDAYRYVSEAYGGYHFDVLHGVNVDAGIFMSYVGLFSYYNFDNWAYQPSYVSSNTPWFFNGVRVQIFPTAHLKIEPWFINGWQAYGSANHRPGVGGQIKWTPFPWMNIISNNYGLGQDDLFVPKRARLHTDNSIEVKYYDRPSKGLDKMAFTLTGDMGCEYGGGVSCTGNTRNGPKQSFLGFMLYNRFWFRNDRYAVTLGGGAINNPGRYLVLIPPINGETAVTASTNSPYFTENPGDAFKAWDGSVTFDWMPSQYITFRWEFDHRHTNVPYWSGSGGITPPGGNNGYPTEYACMNGSPASTIAGCAANAGLWTPDLRRNENLIDIDILVKF